MTDLQLRVSKLLDAFMDSVLERNGVGQTGYREWEAFRQELVAAVNESNNAPRDERKLVAENMRCALRATGGDVVEAARLIGVAHKTVYNRLGPPKKPRVAAPKWTKRYGAEARS